MQKTVDKILLAGLGALSMTRKRAEKIFDEYVRQGAAAKTQRSGFVRELTSSAEKTRKELEDLVAKQVRRATELMDLAGKKDFARLEKKLDRLLKRKP